MYDFPIIFIKKFKGANYLLNDGFGFFFRKRFVLSKEIREIGAIAVFEDGAERIGVYFDRVVVLNDIRVVKYFMYLIFP